MPTSLITPSISDPLLRAYAFKQQQFSVIFSRPAEKRPFSYWGRFIRKPMTTSQTLKQYMDFNKSYAGVDPSIAILTGMQPDGSNLVVVDIDSPEAFACAKELHPDTFIVQSSPGKGHIYLKSNELIASCKFVDGDIKGARNYVIAPYSIHDGDNRYTPLNDNAIQQTIGDKFPFKSSKPLERQPSTFVFEVLAMEYKITGKKGKQKKHEFKSRSEAEYAAVLNMAADGFSFDGIESFFISYGSERTKFKKLNKNLNHIEKKGNSAYLRETYNNALTWLENHPSYCNKDNISLLAINKVSMKFDWRGGAVDDILYSNFLKRALRRSRTVFSYSLDEISCDMAKSKQSCANALTRLQGYGLIKKVKSPTWNLATVWELNLNPKFIASIRVKNAQGNRWYRKGTSLDSSSKALTYLLHDKGQVKFIIDGLMMLDYDFFAFNIGMTRLFMEMRNLGSSTKVELIRALGTSYGTLRRHLPLLIELNLVKQDGKKYQVVDNPDLDAAAEMVGVGGHREKARFECEQRRTERYINARVKYLKRTGQEIYDLATGEALN